MVELGGAVAYPRLEASAPYVVRDTAPMAALPITIALTEDAGEAQGSTEESAHFVLYGSGYIEKY